MASTTLDEAKDRLRETLGKLEKTVDRKLSDAERKVRQGGGTGADTVELEKMRSDFSALKDRLDGSLKESKHLQEEVVALQSQIGREQNKVRNYKAINDEATNRMDGLISELKLVVGGSK